MAPLRSRSSTARYAVPVRAVIRSLRVQANIPSIGLPARSRPIGTRCSAVVVTSPSSNVERTRPGVALAHLRYGGLMDHVEWRERPELRKPALVCAFKGWNDAGEAASAALGFLADSFDATEIARIDPEEFYDFTAVRPTVRLSEGQTRVIDWPDNSLHAARVAGAEHDLVLFQGVEPSLRWRTFCQTVIDMARELGCEMVITLGALLADVPHTRPVPMTGICSDQVMVQRLGFEQSNYEGPTGIVGVLHHACAQAGLTAVSLWASVPHYVAAAPNPKAALALIRSFEGVAGVA